MLVTQQSKANFIKQHNLSIKTFDAWCEGSSWASSGVSPVPFTNTYARVHW